MGEIAVSLRGASQSTERHVAGTSALGISTIVFIASFVLYWGTSSVLEAHGTTRRFGSDADLFIGLADGEVVDRVLRFHPVTVALSLLWMKLTAVLTNWIPPRVLLLAIYALVGAVGSAAATATFALFMPRRQAFLCGLIYASSLGVWYFSSVPESKIVTASFASLYILAYAHLRMRWSVGGVLVLTSILAVACLNEIVSFFLLAIPVVDTVWRYGLAWRRGVWIFLHALTAPACLAFLELVINGRVASATSDPEGHSHLSMLLHYALESDHSLAKIYEFTLNWLAFNMAAPTATAPIAAEYGGYFEASLTGYIASLPMALLPAVLLVMLGAVLWPRTRPQHLGDTAGLLAAVMSYSLVRALFFLMFNPGEGLLFSPAATLPHWMVLLVPFAASRFPGKMVCLSVLLAALLFANGRFMLT